jgi:hypothetical protein
MPEASSHDQDADLVRVMCASEAHRPSAHGRSLRFLLLFSVFGLAASELRSEAPPLLARAIERWNAGQGDLAFTQETKRYRLDGEIKDDRVEHFDPSLPDSRRWRLIEVNGLPATEEQRMKWDSRKNAKPRRKVDEAPAEYLDLDHAVLLGETPPDARFRVPLLPSGHPIVPAHNVDVVITVDQQTGNISRVGAALREPIHTLLGIAEITDLDVDLHLNPDAEPSDSRDEVLPGSSARVKVSELGKPVEYEWRDFKRVASFSGH